MNDYNTLNHGWNLDAHLREATAHHEREQMHKRAEGYLEDAYALRQRPTPGSLSYGVDPEIDRLIDDLWAAHDALLFGGEE